MENQIIDFKCECCGHDKAYKKENALMIYAECISCHEPTLLKSKNKVIEKEGTKVFCPYCKSSNTTKISTTSRVASIAFFGLGSKRIGKQFHCRQCGADF